MQYNDRNSNKFIVKLVVLKKKNLKNFLNF